MFERVMDKLSPLLEVEDMDDAVRRGVRIVMADRLSVRGCVRYCVEDWLRNRCVRGSANSAERESLTRASLWNRAKDGARETITVVYHQQEESEPSPALMEGMVLHAYSMLDWPIDMQRRVRDLYPAELLAYSATEIEAGKTRLLRGRWCRAVAQACPDLTRRVGEQLSSEQANQIAEQIIAAAPEPVLAKKALNGEEAA